VPEGPEIRRAADRLARVLVGQQTTRVWFAFEHLAPFAEGLTGQAVEAVEPRGKALLTRFAGGWNIYSHNQLYGRWYVMTAGRTPRTNRSLRLAIETDSHAALLYSASEIEVLRDDDLGEHPFLSRIGPDVLDPGVEVVDVEQRLRDPRFHRRSVGALLLDQTFASGLGNYLRSEILFVARVDPSVRPKDLHPHKIEDLARATVEISRRAYRHNGVTNDPDDARRRKAEGEPRREYRHFVFARDGKPCRVCGEAVERLEVGARRLYRCPACQAP